MERILLLEDDKSLVTGLAAALLAAECAAWAVCPALCLPLLGLFVLLSAGTYAASGLLAVLCLFVAGAAALLGVTQSSTGMSSPNSSGRNRGQTFSVMEITEAARRLPISQEAGRFLP